MTASSVMAMDLEGLRSSLPDDEGFKLCAELTRDYLAVLSSQDQFRLKLDWDLTWNGLRHEPFSKFLETHCSIARCIRLKCNLASVDLTTVFKEQVNASTCVCESASSTSK